MPRPLTYADVAAIRLGVEPGRTIPPPTKLRDLILSLVDEIERLRAERAELLEIATPVAYGKVVEHDRAYGPMLFHVGADWPTLKEKAKKLVEESYARGSE